MKIFVWLVRLAVFVAIFGLAIKNSGPVDLRFYLDNVWQAPLSVVILLAFAAGIAAGLLVPAFMLARQAHELRRLRKRVGVTETEEDK
ncbi:MAG: LapA family protein [Zoogloeaceae bacterium]|jgi:uncharacterized integral membrane protein|nr:LapA family protein [Zoogloeaceae bacterium]